VTQAGRITIRDVKRSWVRGEFSAPRWNVSADFNDRRGDQLALAGFPVYTSSRRFRASAQGNRFFADGRGRLVYGASYLWETIDSAGPDGTQTLYLEPLTTNQGATFGQVDYAVTDRLKVVGAIRWDESVLHDAQLSPKAAAVFRLARDHSLRVGYNRGFQVGTYTELDLHIPAAAPLDLSALEAALAPVTGGVPLGFNYVPVFAIGNPSLKVEKIQSVEYGYTGAFGSRALVGLDVYHNFMSDFISDLLPGINPQYPAYQAPSALPPASRAFVEQVVNGALPGLTNRADGGPQIVYSNANTGRVRSRGVEASIEYRPITGMSLDASYAWFGFTIEDTHPGAEPQPNAPSNRGSVGLTLRRPRVAFSTLPLGDGVCVGVGGLYCLVPAWRRRWAPALQGLAALGAGPERQQPARQQPLRNVRRRPSAPPPARAPDVLLVGHGHDSDRSRCVAGRVGHPRAEGNGGAARRRRRTRRHGDCLLRAVERRLRDDDRPGVSPEELRHADDWERGDPVDLPDRALRAVSHQSHLFITRRTTSRFRSGSFPCCRPASTASASSTATSTHT
jgi:hypothetical protein